MNPAADLRYSDYAPLIRCPRCGRSLATHRYFEIGAAGVGSKSEERLASLVEQARWSEAEGFQWDEGPRVVWTAIGCPGDGVAVVPVLTAPDGEALVRGTVLLVSGHEQADLERFVGTRWKTHPEVTS